MATPYEVVIRLHPENSQTALRDVLERTLRDTRPFTQAPTIEPTPDDMPDLLVVSTVDANDASEAQVAVREAISQAIRDAGVSDDSVRLGDPEVRANR